MKQNYASLDRAAEQLGCSCAPQEPMCLHTTFRIGGPGDRLLTVERVSQLGELLKILHGEEIPFLVLGKGSNLLVSDKGIRGVVLLLAGEFKKVELLGNGRLRAGAGASLA